MFFRRFPDAVQHASGAPVIRDLQRLGDCNDPGSAAHHYVLRCARETFSGNCGDYPPSAAAMAASAASAFEPSGPPACAMSGRPPPPLPPSASAPLRTRSTALKRATRSLVTPTTMPALPSPVTPTIATIPEPTCFLPSSARLRR